MNFHAQQNGVEVIKAVFTMDEAKKATGKRAGVFFVMDEGLFSSIKKHTIANDIEFHNTVNET